MFSFKRRIKEFEELDSRTREACASYQALVELLSRAMLPGDPATTMAYAERMDALAKQLGKAPEQLAELHPQILTEIDGFEKHRFAYQQAKDLEFQATLSLVGKATAGLTGHHAKCMNHVEETKTNFQGVMHLKNLMEVRQKISTELERLGNGIEKLQSDAEETIGTLRSELERFRNGGQEEDEEDDKRWVTGVALRDAGELILMETIAANMPFALLDIKLDDLNWVERTYGDLCAERVIRQFANALRKAFRRTDTICRWERDEFVVILPGATAAAAARICEQTARVVNTRYRVVAIGKIFEVGLTAGFSGVEWVTPSDTVTPSDKVTPNDRKAATGAKAGQAKANLEQAIQNPAEGINALLRRVRRNNPQWQKRPDFEDVTREPDLD